MSDEIDYRLATSADAATLAVMARDLVELGLGWTWTGSRIAGHVRAAGSVVLVGQRDRRIIAFAVMRFGDEEAHLDLLAVRPRYRRIGVGRRLVEWLEKSALVAGVSVIYLEVRENNQAARAFYEAMGYSRVRQVPGYYRGVETAVCMGRDLWCQVTNSEA